MRREPYAWLPTLIIAMTVAALVFGLLAFQAVETRQLALAGNSLAVTASEIAGNLDRYLDQTLGFISVAAKSSVFRDRDPEKMNEYLEVVLADRARGFLWLGATDAAGRIIASTNPSTLGQNRSNSTWFQAVRDTGAANVGDVEMFLEAGGVEAVPLTVPIMDPQGTFQGTITARVGIPALEEVVTSTVRSAREHPHLPGTYEYQFLLRDGSAFVDSDLEHKGHVNLKRLGLRSAILTESGKSGYVEEEHLRRHVRVVTGYTSTGKPGGPTNLKWGILLRMDRSEILAPIWADLRNLTIAGALIWTPMFVLLLWATRRLRTEWQQAHEESARARDAETSRRQSEGRYRDLVELSQDAIYLLNERGDFIGTNPAGCSLLGYTERELIGMSVLNTYAPEERPAVARRLQQISSGGPMRFERLAVRKDGTTVPIEVSLSPMNQGHYQAIVRDITERKRSEEALRMQARVLESMLEGVSLSDENGVILYTNPAEDAMFGYEQGELIGKHVTTLNSYPPDESARIVEGIIEQLKTKGSWEGMFDNRRKDGVPFTTFARITALGLEGRKHWVCVQEDITERKRAEEKLLLSREIIANAHDPISIMDLQGRFTYQNPAHASLVGFSDDELLGKTPALFLGNDVFSSICQELTRTQSYRGELIARAKDGAVKDLDLSVFTVTDAENKPACFVAIKRDATERKRAEKELRESQERLALVLDATNEGVWDWKVKTGEVYYSSRWIESLGYEPKDVPPHVSFWESIIHPDDMPRVKEALQAHFERQSPTYRCENRLKTKAGTWRWNLDQGKVVEWDADGRPIRMVGTDTDITERKRAEEVQEQLVSELAESRSRFEMFFRETPSAIAITTLKDGRFLDVNKQAEVLTGYSRKELIGHTTVEMNLYVDPFDRPKIVQALQQKGVLTDLERQIRTKSGEVRTAIFSLVPLQMGSEPCLLSIAHDITERRRAEGALRSNEQMLRTLLNEREQLMQDLHDGIIQSLYAIGMSVDECRRLTDEDLRKAAMKLGQTVDDINRVIREVRHHLLQSEDHRPISAHRLKTELARVAGTMERANALHFRLKVDQRAAECLTTEERKEILYVAQEAMSNCLRHSGASVANVLLRLGQDRVVLEVEDDGRGFDTTTLLETGGGLRNIERRAQKVGARVEIVSHREHGTRIRVIVPIRP